MFFALIAEIQKLMFYLEILRFKSVDQTHALNN